MADRAIYAYEVFLRLTDKASGAVSSVVRTEHAYGVMDGVMQALMNGASEHPSADVAFIGIGPPQELIRRAEVQLSAEIAEHIAALGRQAAGAIGTVRAKT